MEGHKTTRKSTSMKVLEGNAGQRKLPNAPKLPVGVPEPPDWLPEEAVAHYRRLAPVLADAGLMTTADRDALADLCVCLVRLQEAEDDLSRNGLVIQSGGKPMKNPAANVAKEYRAHLQVWAKRFGLDPYSRGALDVKPQGEHDPLEELLERR